MLDYLNIERENILTEGPNGCTPWLMTLYNLQRLNDIFDFDNSGLDYYLNLFESIVPPINIQIQKNIVFGNSVELKKQLKESLLKLTRTRNKKDFVYDNEMSIKIASRLIEDSFENKDIEAVLLSMMIKSDYSINFVNKKSEELATINIEEIKHENFYESFDDPFLTLKSFPLTSSDSLVWIISSENKLFQLTLNQEEYLFDTFNDWNLIEFQNWIANKTQNYQFDTLEKDKFGSVRRLFKEDYELQSKEIEQEISFPKIFNTKDTRRVLLVKDMSVSELPHNLLLDENNELLALKASVTNILSVEWLNSKLKEKSTNITNSKSIYIPTEGGDLTICLFQLKSIPEFQSKSIPFRLNKKEDSTPMLCCQAP